MTDFEFWYKHELPSYFPTFNKIRYRLARIMMPKMVEVNGGLYNAEYHSEWYFEQIRKGIHADDICPHIQFIDENKFNSRYNTLELEYMKLASKVYETHESIDKRFG